MSRSETHMHTSKHMERVCLAFAACPSAAIHAPAIPNDGGKAIRLTISSSATRLRSPHTSALLLLLLLLMLPFSFSDDDDAARSLACCRLLMRLATLFHCSSCFLSCSHSLTLLQQTAPTTPTTTTATFSLPFPMPNMIHMKCIIMNHF